MPVGGRIFYFTSDAVIMKLSDISKGDKETKGSKERKKGQGMTIQKIICLCI
jgi:hypothetical protein